MSVVALVIAPSIGMNNNSVTSYVNSKAKINNCKVVINSNQVVEKSLYFDEFSKKRKKK